MRAQCTCETRFGVVVVPAAEATAEKLIFHSFFSTRPIASDLETRKGKRTPLNDALRQPVYVKVFEKMAKVR
jgi:hypothetical protein